MIAQPNQENADFMVAIREAYKRLDPWRAERDRQFKRYCEEVILAIYGDSEVEPDDAGRREKDSLFVRSTL